jgi:type 1 glutamine amidotransferase
MTLSGKHILLLLGGIWHDFEGFSAAAQAIFGEYGCTIEATYDLDRLLNLRKNCCDLVISDTCLGAHRPGYDDTGPTGMSGEQVYALTDWVRLGGGLLAVHSGTVLGDSVSGLESLLGGAFIKHPEAFTFTVYPMFGDHPITAGINAFQVHDEFYIQSYDMDVHILMTALYQDVAYPMVWSKNEGLGRVAHIAMGHFPQVWQQAEYQKLLVQSAGWLINA